MTGLQAFDYQHDGMTLHGQLALPAQGGRRPAVIVMHDAVGMGSLMLRKTEEMAAAGYVAMTADMYGVGKCSGDLEESGKHFMALQAEPEKLRARVLATYDAIRNLPQVDPDRIVAIGYCFGGQCVLELARSGADVKAVVSFHGLLRTARPAPRGGIKARVLAITGAQDPHVPADMVDDFQTEMREADANWHLTIYGQGWHAFTDPENGRRPDIPGVRYDPLLDRLSWAQATEFLNAALAGE